MSWLDIFVTGKKKKPWFFRIWILKPEIDERMKEKRHLALTGTHLPDLSKYQFLYNNQACQEHRLHNKLSVLSLPYATYQCETLSTVLTSLVFNVTIRKMRKYKFLVHMLVARIKLESNICEVPGSARFVALILMWLLETFTLQMWLVVHDTGQRFFKAGFSEGVACTFLIFTCRIRHLVRAL